MDKKNILKKIGIILTILIVFYISIISIITILVKKNINEINYTTNDINDIITYILMSEPTISKYYNNKTDITKEDKNIILSTYIMSKNPMLSDYILLSDENMLNYTIKTDKVISDYIIQNKFNMDILQSLIQNYIEENDKKFNEHINNVLNINDIEYTNTMNKYIQTNDKQISDFITQNGIEMVSIYNHFKTNDEKINNINNLINNYVLKNTEYNESINISIDNIKHSINDSNTNLASYIAVNDEKFNNIMLQNNTNYQIMAENLVNLNTIINNMNK